MNFNNIPPKYLCHESKSNSSWFLLLLQNLFILSFFLLISFFWSFNTKYNKFLLFIKEYNMRVNKNSRTIISYHIQFIFCFYETNLGISIISQCLVHLYLLLNSFLPHKPFQMFTMYTTISQSLLKCFYIKIKSHLLFIKPYLIIIL